MTKSRPHYNNWVLAYVTDICAESGWVEGYIVDMSRYLEERGYRQAGDKLGIDVEVGAETANRLGLAYFKMTMMDGDDQPVLSEPLYVWTPPK